MAAGFIKEQSFLNQNSFMFENRLGSQFSKFIDKDKTYVTYYNICNINSTADNGFQSIDELLGPNSPLRFKEIKDFPVFGIQELGLDLNDDDEGLDINLETELYIQPNSIKPLPNDFFVIDTLDHNFLFRVTGIEYDTIKSNGFYKIACTIKSISGDSATKIHKQVIEQYQCIDTNIGTSDKCLLKLKDYDLIEELSKIYNKISEKYIAYYYIDRYNTCSYTHEYGYTVYDKYLNHFINKHSLITKDNVIRTLYLDEVDIDRQFKFEYEDSIYTNLESCDINYYVPLLYVTTEPIEPISIFTRYSHENVYMVKLTEDENLDVKSYMGKAFDKAIELANIPSEPEIPLPEEPDTEVPTPPDTEEPETPKPPVDDVVTISEEVDGDKPEEDDSNNDEVVFPLTFIDDFIVSYLTNKINTIYDLNIGDIKNINRFKITSENYIKIPMVLFIIKFYMKLFMKNTTDN